MRFLADQDVWATTIRQLRAQGHDVATASHLGLSRAEDIALLKAAVKEGRVLVTRDRDFGNLVFVEGTDAGVIYLRITPSTQDAVHEELERVMHRYSEEQLQQTFVVVEPGRHRFRRLKV